MWVYTMEKVMKMMKPLDEWNSIFQAKSHNTRFETVREGMIKQKQKKKYKNKSKNKTNADSSFDIDLIEQFEPKLFPKDQSIIEKWGLRLLAIIVGIYWAMIVITEAFLIIEPKYTVIYQAVIVVENYYLTFIFTVFFLVTMCCISMFSLLQITFVDFFHLVPKHTDCLTMSMVISVVSKLANVLCYNFITLLKLDKVINSSNVEDLKYGTAFASFYQDLTKVPFFGSYYNYILPFWILIVGFLTLFNFHKRFFKFTSKLRRKKDNPEDSENLNKTDNDKSTIFYGILWFFIDDIITEKNLARGQDLLIRGIERHLRQQKNKVTII